MKFFKFFIVTLALSLSPMALGYVHTETPVDCNQVNFYGGTENTRKPAHYSKLVRRALRGRTNKVNRASRVKSIHSPSKQTR